MSGGIVRREFLSRAAAVFAAPLVVPASALGGSGHATVSVRRRPRVAVIPTGSELVSAEDVERSGGLHSPADAGLGKVNRPSPGKIIEFNSLVLAAQVESWGALATRWPIVPDDSESIKAAVLEAASTHDLVLINAGSSAGTEDWTAHVIRELGEVLVHGVAVRPGHPVIFGLVEIPDPLSTRGEGVSEAMSVASDGGEAQGAARAHTPQTSRFWANSMKSLAREKRHNPTPTEDLLWQSLRNSRLGGLKFRRQHAIGKCIVDFFCPEHALIVEVDGPIHQSTGEYDMARQEYLESFGMRMVRVTADEVADAHEKVLARIMDAVQPGPGLTPGPIGPPPLHAWRGGREARLVPIIGVPGYPVSAALTGEIFVEPLISRWLGRPPYEPPTMQATASRKIQSPPGDDDYVRVTVGRVGEKVIATPLSRGAGVITSLVRADGIVRIPRFSEGVDAGAAVSVHLYRPAAEIARTVVHIGSHDMTLDLLAQFLAERAPAQGPGAGTRLSSANVGSLGGLVALKRGEAHLAGAHLLDPETGQYNWKYIDQYLPDKPVTLVTLVGREQGLIVAAGNPSKIESLDDLARADISFVNRQRGAGTRLLLDYELSKRGIAPEQVIGYEREEYTHLAVAAAVASGTAACGLGVRAAARALDLDFVPVGWERYDLVIPQEFYEGELLRPLLDLLHDDAFKSAVGALEGYDVSAMGTVVQR